MKLFQKDPVKEKLLAEIEKLSKLVAELNGEKESRREELKITNSYVVLKKKLTDLEIEYEKEKEKHEREKRDVEHMVGLERKRQEFEIGQAKREVTITVREENLAAERTRFEDHMTFMVKRFEEEAERREVLMKQILDRLPTVQVDRHIKELVGGAKNGNGDNNGDD